ncbi:protein of unknown function [Shewanella benthica]|uniref:Uncharacterized protein n=1 Tax=Shewanella benthica TaxID=43661 RepID=A0A330M5T4_9GAMM|nr:protein of unknown function [Shewanella benthica]
MSYTIPSKYLIIPDTYMEWYSFTERNGLTFNPLQMIEGN